MVRKLPRRERDMLALRFGLDGAAEARTMAEVGVAFSLTPERIRQLEQHSLHKLRALPEVDQVRDAV
jgi:RNA polymerase primary sigma factor